MADVVENRVVEMRFDNKDFETNAQTSIKTLDELDKSLEFKNSSKGFDEINKGIQSVDFSSLHSEVSSIDNAFMTLAGSIKRNFIDEIAEGLIGLGKTLYDNTIGQIKTGGKQRALNIEQAKFKVKGLNADWDTVYEDMDYAVSGTAYGIDAAANAAAQFLASGVETGDDMKAALRGISGVAAMTSSEYSEIARVFTAAAGKGRVQAIELNRLSLRGINAAAALAKYMGVTESEVREMSRKGQIDFQTFAAAMDSAFGEHAKKANETFTGSLSNVKAALSRIGEIFYEPWLKNMIPVNNRIRESIDKIKNALKTDLLDKYGNKMGSVASAIADIYKFSSRLTVEFLNSLDPMLDRLPYRLEHVYDVLMNIRHFLKGGVNTFKTLNTYLAEWQEDAGGWNYSATELKRKLRADSSYTQAEWDMAHEIVNARQFTADYEAKLNKDQEKTLKKKKLSLEHINDMVYALTYKEQHALDKVTDAEYKKAQKIYNSGKYDKKKGILYNEKMKAELQEEGMDIRNVQKVLDTLSDEQRITKGGWSDLVRVLTTGEVLKSPLHETGAQILLKIYQEMYKAWRTIQLVFEKVRRVGRAIGYAFENVEHTFRGMQWTTYSVVDAITLLVKKFVIVGERGNAIKRIFQGVFSVVKLVQWAFSKVVEFFAGLMDNGTTEGPIFLNFLARFGDYVYALVDAIINGGGIPSLIDTIVIAFAEFFDGIKRMLGEETRIGAFFGSLWKFIGSIVDVVRALIESFVGGTGSIIDTIIYAIIPEDEDPTGEAQGRLRGFLGNLGDIFLGLTEFIATIAHSLSDVFDFAWGIIKDKGQDISDLIGALFEFLTNILKSYEPGKGGEGQSALSKIKDVFFAFCDALIAVFNSLAETLPAIKDPLVAMSESLVKMIGTIADTISGVLEWIGNDPEAAYGMAAFFSLIDLLKTWFENHKNIGHKPFTTSLQNALKTVSEAIYKYCTPTVAQRAKDFAKAALIMAVAIAIAVGAITGGWGMVGQVTGHMEKSTLMNGDGTFREVEEFVEGKSDFIGEGIGAMIGLLAFLTGFAIVAHKLAKCDVSPVSTAATGVLLQAMANAVLEVALSMAALFAILAFIQTKTNLTSSETMKLFNVAAISLVVFFGLIAAFTVLVLHMLEKMSTGIAAAGGALWGVAALIFVMSISLKSIMHSLIDFVIALAMVFKIGKLAGFSSENIIQILGVSGLVLAGILAALIGIIYVIGNNGYAMRTAQPLNLLMIAVMIGVMAHVVKVIIEQTVILIGVMATAKYITGSYTAIDKTIEAIAVILLGMVAIIFVISKVNTGPGIDGAIQIAAMAGLFLTMAVVIRALAVAAVYMQNSGVTPDMVLNMVKLMAAASALVIILGWIASKADSRVVMGLFGVMAALIGLAAYTYLTAKAFWLLSEAFLDLAKNWEGIRDVIPTMIEDLKTTMPEFATLVGAAVREFCSQIIQTAPKIALAVIVVLLSISTILSANAAFIASKWLIAIDGILSALLVGAVVILPKLLALGLIFLGYLEANVGMLVEKLVSIVLKAILGAAVAIHKFLTDFMPQYVEENFEMLNKGLFKKWSEEAGLFGGLAKKFGDMMYEAVHGETLAATEMRERMQQAQELGYYFEDGIKVILDKEKYIEYLAKSNAISMEEARKMYEDEVKEIQGTYEEEIFNGSKARDADESEVEELQRYADKFGAAGKTFRNAMQNEVKAEEEYAKVKKEQNEKIVADAKKTAGVIDDTAGELEKTFTENGYDVKNAGVSDGQGYWQSMISEMKESGVKSDLLDTLNDIWKGATGESTTAGENSAQGFMDGFKNKLTSMFGLGDQTMKVDVETNSEKANTGFNNFLGKLGLDESFKNVTDNFKNIGEGMTDFLNITPLTQNGMFSNATQWLDMTGATDYMHDQSLIDWDAPTDKYGFATSGENPEDMANNVLGALGFGGNGFASYGMGNIADMIKTNTEQSGENLSILGKIKEGLEYVTQMLGDTVVMPKNTYIKLKNEIDGKEISNATLPIMNTIDAKKATLKENRLAVGKKTGM